MGKGNAQLKCTRPSALARGKLLIRARKTPRESRCAKISKIYVKVGGCPGALCRAPSCLGGGAEAQEEKGARSQQGRFLYLGRLCQR